MDAPITSPINSSAAFSATSSTRQSPAANVILPAAAPAPSQAQSPSTDVFLRDFSLVAEAAKRAQVAVMVRDFESCGLS